MSKTAYSRIKLGVICAMMGVAMFYLDRLI